MTKLGWAQEEGRGRAPQRLGAAPMSVMARRRATCTRRVNQSLAEPWPSCSQLYLQVVGSFASS